MSQTIISTCDLCGSTEDVEQVTIPCVFTTEQTEGRGREPYLTHESIDACNKCYGRVLQEQPVWASGAQGNNTYFWKHNEPTDSPERQDN